MRGFLFNENLQVQSLRSNWPITRACALGARLTDSQLWLHARENDLAIVTKDADFSQRIVLNAPPPRVVHLRVGTCADVISQPGWNQFGPELNFLFRQTSS